MVCRTCTGGTSHGTYRPEMISILRAAQDRGLTFFDLLVFSGVFSGGEAPAKK